MDTVSLTSLAIVLKYAGLTGLILILWWVDQRRIDKILTRYKEHFGSVVKMYEDNVKLVKDYNKLAEDLANIIHLNTQTQTQLVESIKHNQFCPQVRKAGGFE